MKQSGIKRLSGKADKLPKLLPYYLDSQIMNTIQSILAFHRLLSLPEPKHPMVSVINLSSVFIEDEIWKGFTSRYYCVALKRNATGKIKYGQQHYDYDKGVLSFTAPSQVQYLDVQTMDCENTGYLLIFMKIFC
jgi:hypothetical protein